MVVITGTQSHGGACRNSKLERLRVRPREGGDFTLRLEMCHMATDCEDLWWAPVRLATESQFGEVWADVDSVSEGVHSFISNHDLFGV